LWGARKIKGIRKKVVRGGEFSRDCKGLSTKISERKLGKRRDWGRVEEKKKSRGRKSLDIGKIKKVSGNVKGKNNAKKKGVEGGRN